WHEVYRAHMAVGRPKCPDRCTPLILRALSSPSQGSFNNWQAAPMEKAGGLWRFTVRWRHAALTHFLERANLLPVVSSTSSSWMVNGSMMGQSQWLATDAET